MPIRTFRSVEDIDAAGYIEIFRRADQLREQHENGVDLTGLLSGRWVACLFQGHSTRTKAVMQAACIRLGATCTDEEVFERSYSSEGLETLEEALICYASLADLLVIRHQSVDLRSPGIVLSIPIINAMCGPNEHSLAAIGRAYSLWRLSGNLSALRVGVYGWIPASRPLKALIRLLCLFGTQIYNDPVLTEEFWLASDKASSFIQAGLLTNQKVETFLAEVDAMFISEGLQQKDSMSAEAADQYCARFERIGESFLAKMKRTSLISVGMPDVLSDGSSTILPEARNQVQRAHQMILADWLFSTEALLCYLFGV